MGLTTSHKMLRETSGTGGTGGTGGSGALRAQGSRRNMRAPGSGLG